MPTAEGKPGYPEHLNLEDETGRYSDLAGLYKRKTNTRYIGQQGVHELTFDGNIVCIIVRLYADEAPVL